ncbi:MAG TPA: DUF1648 domain-containing protein [Casimicrobiaceae bacterium]|jgi:hypothetical protein|nr:DUF1648 domain-containing protein [Casimicrobiaceae bacterium]
MRYLAAALLAALLAAGAVTLYVTADSLPAVVATHFDLAGRVTGAMSRASYLVFISLMTFAVPLFVAVLNAVLPRFVPRLARIPARDYWLAPERRDETLASIAASGTFLACMIAAFMIGLHLLLVEANTRKPPTMDSSYLWLLLSVFIVVTLVAQFLRWQRFRRPG